MKQKFLLHICCGPCVVAILEELKQEFDVVAYFYNPNIHPEQEYEKRKTEVIRICKNMDIPFVEEEYNPEDWFKWARDFADEPEGGKRCEKCFAMRLEKTAKYASQNGFDWFGSTLTSGRNKKADIINPIGMEAGESCGIKFYEEDWKKKGRQEKAINLAKQRQIYRQNYCGCIYSLNNKQDNKPANS